MLTVENWTTMKMFAAVIHELGFVYLGDGNRNPNSIELPSVVLTYMYTCVPSLRGTVRVSSSRRISSAFRATSATGAPPQNAAQFQPTGRLRERERPEDANELFFLSLRCTAQEEEM